MYTLFDILCFREIISLFLFQFARGGALVFGLGYGTLRLRYLEGKENRIARKEAAAG
jgi:hypothetical protein